MDFFLLGNSDNAVISVSIDFPSNSQQAAKFHCISHDYSRADLSGHHDHLRDVPWEDIFKLSISVAGSEFCERVQVGIDVYIRHQKYQVKHHSSPWLSATCTAATVYRNPFFCLHQQNESPESKAKFRQASNHWERFLEVTKLAYVSKTNDSIASNKLGSQNFQCKSAIPPIFNSPEVLSYGS